MKAIYRNVDITTWSCKTAAQNLIEFMEKYYFCRDVIEGLIKRLHKDYINGIFSPQDAMNRFMIIVSASMNLILIYLKVVI